MIFYSVILSGMTTPLRLSSRAATAYYAAILHKALATLALHSMVIDNRYTYVLKI